MNIFEIIGFSLLMIFLFFVVAGLAFFIIYLVLDVAPDVIKNYRELKEQLKNKKE